MTRYVLDEVTSETITAQEVLELLRWFHSSYGFGEEPPKPAEISASEEIYNVMSPGLKRHFKKEESKDEK